MRAALKKVVDIGVWTLGLASIVALPWHAYQTSGLIEGVGTAALLLVTVFILGVTGYYAVGSVDDVLGGGQGPSERWDP